MLRRYQNLRRQRAEDEAKFQALVEQLPVTTYIHSLEHPGSTLYISDQIRDLSGFLPQELMEDDGLWDSRIPEPHRSAALAAAEHHKRSGEPLALEYPFVTRSGETIWIGHRARVVHGGDGRALYTEGVVFDITAAKEREKPLLQRMKVLDAAFDSAPVGVVTMTASGQVASVNAALEQMLGYARHELTAMTLRDVIAPEAADELQTCLYKTIAGEMSPHQTEVELVAKGGDVVCSNVTMLTVPGEDDEESSSLLCVILEDVTERRRSRQELKETADQLQGVISNLPVIVFTFDDELRLSMLEGRGATEFGTDLNELVGLSALELLANVPEALHAVKSALAGEQQHIVAEFDDFGGWWEVWYSPLRAADDSIVGVLGVGTNVSERVAHEKVVERSVALLHATLDSIADGIVVLGDKGQVLEFNRRFLEMWNVPDELLTSEDSTLLRAHVYRQFRDPISGRHVAEGVLNDPTAEAVDLYELEDGRAIERHIGAPWSGGEVTGRVVRFRDVTQEHRTNALLEIRRGS